MFGSSARVVALAAALLACGSSATAAERFDARTWNRVKTYDMPALQQFEALPPGRIIGVKFNYRRDDLRQLHPHWYFASIWRVVRDAEKADFMHVNVMVRENDLAAFRAITTDFRSEKTYVVYGEALHYRDTSFPFLRLIGTKVKRDKRGNVSVSW